MRNQWHLKKFMTGLLMLLIAAPSFAQKALSGEPIQPIPLKHEANDKKAELGERLFLEPRLSQNNSISCASCHNLQRGGVDNLVKSIGIRGAIGDINSPTVFNSSLNFRQFWNGRARNLNEQIDGPIAHPKEMGSSWQEVIQKLEKDDLYKKQFSELYPDGISAKNIKDAIVNFEMTLLTPNARFDRYLRGEKDAHQPMPIWGDILLPKIQKTNTFSAYRVSAMSL